MTSVRKPGAAFGKVDSHVTSLDRHHRAATVVVVVAGAGIVLYGVLALFDPSMLTAGFETFTGGSWPAFAATEGDAAEFILIEFRLLGGLNVNIGMLLVAIATTAFRRGDRWSWWVLLLGNTLAYGIPMVYDQVVGYIGVFEILEYVALAAVYVALAATWRLVGTGASRPASVTPSGRSADRELR